MPEPITIISALATIFGVTVSSSIQLTNIFSSINQAPKEILSLYLELKSVQSVILDIQKSFENGGVSDSLSIEWVEDLDLTLRRCMGVLTELTGLISKLKSTKETGWYKRKWKGIKWTFLERDVTVLTARLESIKATLGLKLQALSTMIGVRVEGRVDQLHNGVGEMRDILNRLVSEQIVESSERAFLERNISGVPGYNQISPAQSPGCFPTTPPPSNSPPSYWGLFFSSWKSEANKNTANEYSFEESRSFQQDNTRTPDPHMTNSYYRMGGSKLTPTIGSAELRSPTSGPNNCRDYSVSVGIRFGSNSSSAVYLVSSKGGTKDKVLEWTDLGNRLVSKIPTVLYYNHGGQVAGWVHDTVNALESNGSPRFGTQRISTLYSNLTVWKPWATPATLPCGNQQIDVAVEYLLKLREAIYTDLYRDFGHGFRPKMAYHLVTPVAFNDTEKETLLSAMTQLGFLGGQERSQLTMVTEPEAAIANFLNAKSMALEANHAILIISFGSDRIDLIAYQATEGVIVPCTYRSGDTSGSKSPRNKFRLLAQNKVAAMRIHEQVAEKVFEKCMLFFENEINEGFSNCGRDWRLDLSAEGQFFRAGVIDKDGFMTFTNEEILRCFTPICEQAIDLARAQIKGIQGQGLQTQGVLLMAEFARPGYLLNSIELRLKHELPQCFISPVDSCAAIADGAARAGLMSEIRR